MIDAEFNNIEHKRGIVSMARSSDPNSAGSQFFIVHKDSTFWTVNILSLGRIITDESFETLDRIAIMDTAPNDQPMDAWKVIIKNVQVLNRSEISDLPEYNFLLQLMKVLPLLLQQLHNQTLFLNLVSHLHLLLDG